MNCAVSAVCDSVKYEYRPRAEEAVSRNMAAIGSKNSRAELLLRRVLHGRGLRYRVHDTRWPGTPDITFAAKKVAVFVDGDYWHGRVLRESGPSGVYARVKKNSEFWLGKFQRNIDRDETVNQTLAVMGWTVIRIWESDVIRNPDGAADMVVTALGLARAAMQASEISTIAIVPATAGRNA